MQMTRGVNINCCRGLCFRKTTGGFRAVTKVEIVQQQKFRLLNDTVLYIILMIYTLVDLAHIESET
jgi:hypothetical protein